MKGKFVDFLRGLRDPVRARRQEKIREVELTWSDHDLANFRAFALGLPSAEMADVCYALADATAIPLLGVLVDYAEVNKDLMAIALASLDKAPLSARLFLANRLFASSQAAVRAATCDLLGGVGPSAAPLLAEALDDENPMVEAAAIRALARIGHTEAGPQILERLDGGTEEVRSLVLETMAGLEPRAPAFVREALTIFRDSGENITLRRLAAAALAAAGSAEGRLAMLDILSDVGEDSGLRRIAAEALGGFADNGTVAALLEAMRGEDSVLAEGARQAVAAMDPAVVMGILAGFVCAPDEAVAMLAAGLLGGMKDSRAGEILANLLMDEKRPLIADALAGALGKSGHRDAWKALSAKLRRDGRGSMPLLASLADAATVKNIDEFAALLDDLPESGAGEVVLRRLAAFARTVRPSPAVVRRAVAVLDSGNRGLAVPAVEILAYSGEDGMRDRLLTEMAWIGPEVPTRRLLRVMLGFKDGELAALFEGVGSAASPLLRDAALEADRVGGGAVAFFSTIAGWAREEAKGAKEGLAAAARLDPANLVKAMPSCPDRVFLLEAWAGLGERDRLTHFPDLDGIFAAADARNRLFALRCLAGLRGERHLRSVAMLAFTERDANVKAAAISLTRAMAMPHED